MTWNYRIIKHDLKRPAYYAVHEVFYNDNNKITNWTAGAIDVIGENQKDILATLKRMIKDIDTPLLLESRLLKVDSSIFHQLTLVETCNAFPEQYDVFLDNKQVGYLRLRGGKFRVDYPDCGGETIYKASPDGWGFFTDYERNDYITEAKLAIQEKIIQDSAIKKH